MLKIKLFYISILFFSSYHSICQVLPTSTVLNQLLNKKALEYRNETNFNKASLFFIKNNWDSTLVYSMKQLISSKNKELSDYCHFFRGYSFREKKKFKEAQSEMLLVSNKFELYPLVNKNLGQISLELKEFNKAINYFKEVEKLTTTNNQGFKISPIYNNIGLCYFYLKQFIEAEEYFMKSLALKEKEKDTVSLIGLHLNIASLYYDQYKDNQAIPYFEKAYNLSKKTHHFESKYNASSSKSVVEENRGSLKKALIYRKESEQWKDSLNNQNKIWAVADFEKKYAVAQKQKQISLLKVENELKNTQRNTMFFSTIGLLLLLTGGVYVYGQKVKNAKIILSQKEKLDELNATKDQLFSIVSHDLRSSVNALKTSNTKLTSSLESKNYDELDKLLHQNSAIANGAYSLLDNLLHWALLQTQQLYFHKDSVHLFSIVQQIEYSYKPLLLEKTIVFENEVSKNCFIFVDLDSLKIILRNLLDNAIKFSPENSSIRFYSLDTPSEFHQFIIEDQGIGMRPETIAELLEDNELLAKKSNSEIIGTGLGMQLCKQMIQKMAAH
jgi:signal transduction histidine kinase